MPSRGILKYAGIGLGLVALAVAIIFISNRGAQIRLEGSVQKVRIQPTDENSCAVIVDFRFTNPADYPFIVREAKIYLEDATGRRVEGRTASAGNVKTMMEYFSRTNPELGPQYNEVLIVRDRVEPGQYLDRMVCARFEIPASQAAGRKRAIVVVEDVDGALTEIAEEPAAAN